MKYLKHCLLFALAIATPCFAQTYDQNTTYPTGSCTTTPSALVGLNRYTRAAYSEATNLVSCTGVFNGNVTGKVSIQYQDLYLLNLQNTADGKYSVADTFYLKSRIWPQWTRNPDCIFYDYSYSCPAGEESYVISDPIPTATPVLSSTSGSRCFRAVTEITWKETFYYTRTRTVKGYSAWTGTGCQQ